MKIGAKNIVIALSLASTVGCSEGTESVDQLNHVDNTKTVDTQQSDAGEKVNAIMKDAGPQDTALQDAGITIEPPSNQEEPEGTINVPPVDSGSESDPTEEETIVDSGSSSLPPEPLPEVQDAGTPSEVQPPAPQPMNDGGVEEQQYLTRAAFAKSLVYDVLQLGSEEECISNFSDINGQEDPELCHAANILKEREAMPGVYEREIMPGGEWMPNEPVSAGTTWGAAVSAVGFPVYETECSDNFQWINNEPLTYTRVYIGSLCDKGFSLGDEPIDIYANQTRGNWEQLKRELEEYLDQPSTRATAVEAASAIIMDNWYLDDLQCESPVTDVEDNAPLCIALNNLIDQYPESDPPYYSGGEFRPNSPISTAELMKIFVEADGGELFSDPRAKCFQGDEFNWYFPYADTVCRWGVSALAEMTDENIRGTSSRRTVTNMAFDIKNRDL